MVEKYKVKEKVLDARRTKQEYGLRSEYWDERIELQNLAEEYLTEELGIEEDTAQTHASQLENNVAIDHIYDALDLVEAWSSLGNIENHLEPQKPSAS